MEEGRRESRKEGLQKERDIETEESRKIQRRERREKRE